MQKFLAPELRATVGRKCIHQHQIHWGAVAECLQLLAGIAPEHLSAAGLVVPTASITECFQAMEHGFRPEPDKLCMAEGKVKWPGIQFQAPPLQGQRRDVPQGFHQRSAVVPQAHADIEDPQVSTGPKTFQLRGCHEFGLRFTQRSSGAVEGLCKQVAVEAEASVGCRQWRQLAERMACRRLISCAAFRVHPRRWGSSQQQRHCAPGWSLPRPASLRWPGSWRRGDRSRCRGQPP